MATVDPCELARKYYAAYETKDRAVVDALLADDFIFTSPHDDHIGRKTYFEKCWPNSAKIRTIEVETLCRHGSEIFVRYRLQLFTGAEFRNTEVLRFESDTLAEVDVYFGRTLKEASRQRR